jgi:hypothetical protein
LLREGFALEEIGGEIGDESAGTNEKLIVDNGLYNILFTRWSFTGMTIWSDFIGRIYNRPMESLTWY